MPPGCLLQQPLRPPSTDRGRVPGSRSTTPTQDESRRTPISAPTHHVPPNPTISTVILIPIIPKVAAVVAVARRRWSLDSLVRPSIPRSRPRSLLVLVGTSPTSSVGHLQLIFVIIVGLTSHHHSLVGLPEVTKYSPPPPPSTYIYIDCDSADL